MRQTTIKSWLAQARKILRSSEIESATLDAEILLCDTLSKDRTYIHAHPEMALSENQVAKLNNKLARRAKRVPLAYIRGFKEFYGRKFTVSPTVLIPRSDSECIIDIVNSFSFKPDSSLLDIGTGSGVLGITIKLEKPEFNVTLSDISKESLIVAETNARTFDCDVDTIQSNLLQNINKNFDIIVANLPYVDKSWSVSPETKYEPSLALFADEGGLDLICQLIIQAKDNLSSSGYLILEADERQHNKITNFAIKNGYKHVLTSHLTILLQIN